jgi:hypothetical protein
VAGDFLRYGLNFNPIPASTDPWTKPVAGGASDTYLSATLALRVHFERIAR